MCYFLTTSTPLYYFDDFCLSTDYIGAVERSRTRPTDYESVALPTELHSAKGDTALWIIEVGKRRAMQGRA